VRQFAADRRGATAIEYGLIAFVISLTLIVGMTAVGTTIEGTFTYLASKLP
jgi:pilus assembly protein Flp/PilA